MVPLVVVAINFMSLGWQSLVRKFFPVGSCHGANWALVAGRSSQRKEVCAEWQRRSTENGARKGPARERGHDEAEARMPSRKHAYLRPRWRSSNPCEVGSAFGLYGSDTGTSGRHDAGRTALSKRVQSVAQAKG